MLQTGESKLAFKQRLQSAGLWERFVQRREELKRDGMDPAEAWAQAARDVDVEDSATPPAEASSTAAPIVDCWLVLGQPDDQRTQAMLAAFRDRVPMIVLRSTSDFAPAMLAGFECIGVLAARPQDQADAQRLVERLQGAIVDGQALLFREDR